MVQLTQASCCIFFVILPILHRLLFPFFFTSHPPLTAGSVSSLCWRIWSDGGIQHAESGLALFLNGSGLVEDNYSYTSWLSKVTIRVSRAFESDKSNGDGNKESRM